MKETDAYEQAYKNGYEAGKREARPKGKWVIHRGLLKCSECGGIAFYGEVTCKFFPSSYCQHCGAEMRGEKE